MSGKIFGLIALTAVMEQAKAPKHFLYDILVGKETTEKTEEFEIHTREAGRKKAPLVGRRERGVFVKKEAFAVTRVKPAYIKLNAVNEAEAIFEQQFGGTPYDNPQEVGNRILADILNNFRDISFRTRLWMLVKTVLTGTCPMEEGKLGISYGDVDKEVLSSTALWTDPACDPIKYLEKKQYEIQKKTGVVIDTVVVSPDVAGAFLDNAKVKEYLNSIHSNYIRVNDSQAEDVEGKKLVAIIPTLNITIYSFVDWYTDMDNNNETTVIPEKTIIGFKAKSFNFQYGALALRPEQGKRANLYVKKQVVRTWYPDTSEDEELQYFSAPLCVPGMDVKSWFVAEVIK